MLIRTGNHAQEAFETALRQGALSHVRGDRLYVGDYMYMGDNATGEHLFKHQMTRAYLPPVKREG